MRALAAWRPNSGSAAEVPFLPARVVMQDFTGVPCVVDLAAMRDAMAELGGDPEPASTRSSRPTWSSTTRCRSTASATRGAFAANVEREYERNRERYMLLRWAQQAFADFRTVPAGHRHRAPGQPGVPLAGGAVARGRRRADVAFPDTLVGTDSHTTMINGIGVLGFGVGGIEAEAVLLGQPLSQPTPTVIGLKLTGRLGPGRDGHRPRADGHRDAARARRGRQVRRAVRRRPLVAEPGRPGDDLEHVAGVRRHGDDVPDRRRDAALHGADRPRRPRRSR